MHVLYLGVWYNANTWKNRGTEGKHQIVDLKFQLQISVLTFVPCYTFKSEKALRRQFRDAVL